MNRHGRLPVRAGLACTLILAVSCSTLQSVLNREQIEVAFDEAQVEELELVRATIEDPHRVETFEGLLAEREALLERYAVIVADHRGKVSQLDRDYRSSRQDFDELLDEFNRNRAAAQRELVELSYRMKQATTPEEWLVISTFQTEKLDLRRLAYRDRADGD